MQVVASGHRRAACPCARPRSWCVASHASDTAGRRQARERAPDVDRLERGLRDALATKVTISTARKGGRITIEYYDEEDLERLYERLTGSRL